MVDRRMEPHDANQLELKLGYVVDRTRKRQRYRVECWTFVPRTLGVSKATYSTARFYEDTAAFVRMKTPTVALAALARAPKAAIWFRPVADRLDRLLAGEVRVDGTAAHRLKLLGCIYRSAIRDETDDIVRRYAPTLEHDAGNPDTSQHARDADLARTVDRFLADLAAALERLRGLGERCDHAAMDTSVREVWRAVDEYVTLYSEEALTRLVEMIDRRVCGGEGREGIGELRKRVAVAAVEAYRYRRARGHASYVDKAGDNELLPYRRHLLKRIVSSALYLDIRHQQSGGLVTNVIGMVAAAVAMLFAMLAALWAQGRWGNFSAAFVASMVLSYMIKDRIKEWGRQRLGRSFQRFVPDHVVEIRDVDSGRVVGECRESFSLVDPAKIDAEIRRLRHIDHPSAVSTDGRPESVLRYTKDVNLDSAALERLLEGVEGLNDIIRFNLSRLRERMDDPVEAYHHIDPHSLELMSVPCARVYHVNIVLRFTTGRGAQATTEVERVRVVLDQRGIKRIESITVGARVGSIERVLDTTMVDRAELA
ncbi:MAG: hypothetical protein H6744_03425 [Deltaproteobacteria bacterium]|nr:hypothetical protein [Deltaproteobacteria bacterium]MCB9785727.1 hypothetical protein [Deltaproteobacteria bacterium]